MHKATKIILTVLGVAVAAAIAIQLYAYYLMLTPQ